MTLQTKDSSFSSQTMQTRSRILGAALRLFNEHGYYAVNTHDIARAADMSPGNLYYHFKNKEAIVLEIFQHMDIFSEQKWYERGPANPKESFLDFIRFFFGNLTQYRFFFHEFSLILQTVPLMTDMWKMKYEKLQNVMRKAADLWVQAGILRPFADQESMGYFIESCWILTNFSAVHLELSNKNKASKDKARLHLLVRFLHPYHTPRGQRALDLYLT